MKAHNRIGPPRCSADRNVDASQRSYRTDVHELLGTNIVSAEEESLVIVVEQLEQLGLILHSIHSSDARNLRGIKTPSNSSAYY